MASSESKPRNFPYVQYSQVEESVTSTSSTHAATDAAEPSPQSGSFAGALKVMFGHHMAKILAAVMLVASILILAGAITVALTVGGRQSQQAGTSPTNQSTLTTASIASTSSSLATFTTAATTVTSSSLATFTTAATTVTSSSPELSSSPTSSASPTSATSTVFATTTVESHCQSSEFTCSNNECIRLELKCNGIPECSDGSDESMFCACTVGQFRCPSGQCVPSSAVCNEVYDCLDKGDEANCPDCTGFRCLSNNVCLWDRMYNKCNQIFDCEDYSDELDCEHLLGLYQCSNGVRIHKSNACDGLDDCGDNSDEQHCACKGRRQFACSGELGKCISKSWLCDGHPDCDNGTDERNCGTCGEGSFQCADYTCVDISLRCDGKVDCNISGGDEDGCVTLTAENELQVMLNTRMYPVCADNWTEPHSLWVCDALHGRSVLSSVTVPASVTMTHFAALKDFTSAPGIDSFHLSDACQSEAVVHVRCLDAGCGQRKVGVLESYVASGNIAALGKWPWVVSLAYLDTPVCGGALINARWVLTAAHCIMSSTDLVHDYSKVPFYYTIKAGAVSIFGNISSSAKHADYPDPQVVRVSRIHFHPERSILDNGGVDWDIALLQLETDVVMSDIVQPVCLPSYAQVFAPASFCYLAGWGLLSFRQHLRSGQLRDTRMQLWSENRCQSNVVIGEHKVNTNSTLCAGYLYGRPTSCQGDSGGPLMCLDPATGRYVLAGLVSRGSVECGDVQSRVYSNRFARVAMAIKWLDEVMRE